MDALTFMNEFARMCNFYNKTSTSCASCPLANLNCDLSSNEAPKTLILEKVKEWSEARPRKTRQSEFLKMFPNAKIAKNGFLLLTPCDIEPTAWEDCNECCDECRARFWNEEVDSCMTAETSNIAYVVGKQKPDANKVLMEQRAFYEKVEHNLWRFSMENGGSGNWVIGYDVNRDKWIYYMPCNKYFGPSFKTEEITRRAIDEVLIPLIAKESKRQPCDLFEWSI